MPNTKELKTKLAEITDKILGMDKMFELLGREYSHLLKESNRLHDEIDQINCEHVWSPDKPFCLKCGLPARELKE